MSELKQLQDYCDYLEEFQGDIDVSVVTSGRIDRTVTGVTVSRRWPKGLIVGVGVAILVVLAFVPVLLWTGDGSTPPVTQVPVTTVPPETTVPQVESNRPQLESQYGFLQWFASGEGGCEGPESGPFTCVVEYHPPLVAETVRIETVVEDTQTTPGEPPSPDDLPVLTAQADESREVL